MRELSAFLLVSTPTQENHLATREYVICCKCQEIELPLSHDEPNFFSLYNYCLFSFVKKNTFPIIIKQSLGFFFSRLLPLASLIFLKHFTIPIFFSIISLRQ